MLISIHVTINIGNIDPKYHKLRILKNKLPMIEKSLEKIPYLEKPQRPHHQSFVMSEQKVSAKFDNIDSLQRSSIQLKKSIFEWQNYSTNRRKYKRPARASKLLFKRNSNQEEQSYEPQKSNSLTSHYKEERKFPNFVSILNKLDGFVEHKINFDNIKARVSKTR